MSKKNKQERKLDAALLLHHGGQLDRALSAYNRILRENSRNHHALHYAGLVLFQQGKFEEAIGYITRAIQIRDDIPEFHLNLGNAYKATGQPEQARGSYAACQNADPNGRVGIYCAVQSALIAKDESTAVAALEKLLSADDSFAEGHYQLAKILSRQGKTDEAIRHIERAEQLRPSDPAILSLSGTIYKLARAGKGAVEKYNRLIEIEGLSEHTAGEYAEALLLDGRAGEAEAACTDWLARQASDAVEYQLASALLRQGKTHDAIRLLSSLVDTNPTNYSYYSNYLLACLYDPSETRESLFLKHRDYSRHLPAVERREMHLSASKPKARLRIGFLSPDLNRHPVGRFLEPILRHIDRNLFEVVCFNDAFFQDHQTETLRRNSDEWHSVANLDSDNLFAFIRNSRIDILIDTTGHMAFNRMRTFARKCARVQVSFLGYPATTGLESIDYRITDQLTDPPDSQSFSTEKLVYLEPSYFCYLPPSDIPQITQAPVLDSGRITFGSFNSQNKINDYTLQLWSSVLREVPGSRLKIKLRSIEDKALVSALYDRLRQVGIEEHQVGLIGYQATQYDYWHSLSEIDIHLDTFPYSGATTTCEATLMGVPTVTMAGDTHASRMSASILSTMGLQELVAYTKLEFIEKCCAMAHDRQALSTLRESLRDQLVTSPLCNEAIYTDNFNRILNEFRVHHFA